jgi:hypothetical protein
MIYMFQAVSPPIISSSKTVHVAWGICRASGSSKQAFIFRVCVCSLWLPASNAHLPRCHLWPALLCSIFPHYLKAAQFSKKMLLSMKCVFWFLYNVYVEHFLFYRGADKSLARPTSRCILFDGEIISFDASPVLYVYILLIFLQLW